MNFDTNDLAITNNLLIDLTDHLHTLQVKIESHQRYLEIQSVKYAFHTSTLIQLFNGTQIKTVKFPDLGSMLLLIRAQLETYLMFYYLNVENVTLEEKELRILLFEASGLGHRQKFRVTKQEHQAKKNDDFLRLTDIKTHITQNIHFQRLSTGRQSELLKKLPARLFGWVDLIKKSNLKNELFVDTWSLCSNYAHSEYLSLIQFKQYISNLDELHKTIKHIHRHATILTTVLCFDLLQLFPQLIPFYNEKATAHLLRLAAWNEIGTKKQKA